MIKWLLKVGRSALWYLGIVLFFSKQCDILFSSLCQAAHNEPTVMTPWLLKVITALSTTNYFLERNVQALGYSYWELWCIKDKSTFRKYFSLKSFLMAEFSKRPEYRSYIGCLHPEAAFEINSTKFKWSEMPPVNGRYSRVLKHTILPSQYKRWTNVNDPHWKGTCSMQDVDYRFLSTDIRKNDINYFEIVFI